jgi:phosphoserine phosphatase
MRTAIVYDFDGTLARGNMQDVALLPRLGVKTKAQIDAFWGDVLKQTRAEDGDQVLAYLRRLVEVGHEQGTPLTRETLKAAGNALAYFEGVDTWFDRISAFGETLGLKIEHYVVSAGNREIIEGSDVFVKFEGVFGCKYHFDSKGQAAWPSVVVNYTTKTQFLFRINKGIDNCWDQKAINEWMPEADRPIPFSRMIFVGDGDTDIPSFKMMMTQGGVSVAVFDPEEWKDKAHHKTHDLIAEGRVHFVAPADYTEMSELDIIMRGVLDRIARANRVHPGYFADGKFSGRAT